MQTFRFLSYVNDTSYYLFMNLLRLYFSNPYINKTFEQNLQIKYYLINNNRCRGQKVYFIYKTTG